MDFGKVSATDLTKIDLSLSAEPAWNSGVLNGSETKAIIRIGAAKWNSPDLIANLYPQKIKETDGLKEYNRHFDTIEFNTTHYKLYPTASFTRWAGDIENPNFKFCPKIYQGISHRGPLKGKGFITNTFIDAVQMLGIYLGPSFLQLDDSYSAKRKDEFFEYIDSIPKEFEFFVELRHWSWFEPGVFSEVLRFLQSHEVGLIITDTPGRRDVLHMHLTLPKCFVRFVAVNNGTDYERLNAWTERLLLWQNAGLKDGYFFIHADDNNILYLLRMMQEKIGTVDR